MRLNKNSKIFLAGHNGMVGSAILRYFRNKKYRKIFYEDKKTLNFLDQKKTEKYLLKIKPDFVIIAAARVGGIHANNQFKGEFIYENLMIQTNILHSSYRAGVKKLIFLGSSCIYPKFSKQPIKEKYLLSGKLEPTNRSYSIAKIAGIEMCRAFSQQFGVNYTSVQPNNLYGPNDNFTDDSAHVISSLFRKLEFAKKKKS